MRIKKYVADSMSEALKLVKADLGSEAIVLNKRTIRKSSALGILGKSQVEITAAVDKGKAVIRQAGGALQPKIKTPAPAPRSGKPRISKRTPVSQKTRTADAADAGWADRLSRQIEELQTSLESMGQPTALQGNLILPGALDPLSKRMLSAGFEPTLTEEILKSLLLAPGDGGLEDLKGLYRRAAQMLAERCQPPSPTVLAKGVRTVVALVGPAGVGKTTAAARIAAQYSSEKKARTAFIAADPDRVGGLEQLRAYASILQTPLDIAQTPEEMGEVIHARRDVDLILIDTSGTSPVDAKQLENLGKFLREAGPSEIHLVLSATTDYRQMKDSISAFSRLGADRLLFTKLDETLRLGAACSFVVISKLPLSFTTDGRSVPGNLHPGDPCRLAVASLNRRANVLSG